MMIRSLLFTLLGALCSINNLFNAPQQTAMICVLAYCILLVRHANAFRWTADSPGKMSTIFEQLEYWWDCAIGDYVNWRRPKVHLPSHWGQLYLILGAPVQHSTMHFIEAMQRMLKAAWRFTSKRADVGLQVMQRISVLRWIHSRLRPSTGTEVDAVGALHDDKVTQAYLTGTLIPKAGVNTTFSEPENGLQQSWNGSLSKALRDLNHPDIPLGHAWHADRAYPRRAGTFVRSGIAAVSVAALPVGCSENCMGNPVNAIFSVFEGAAAAPGAVAPVRESSMLRFIVDFWISYNITGLTAVDQNPPPDRLSARQLNKDDEDVTVIDLAVGRWLVVQPTITASGDSHRESAASYVFQRVKPSAKTVIMDVAELCQPLWAIPYLATLTMQGYSLTRTRASGVQASGL